MPFMRAPNRYRPQKRVIVPAPEGCDPSVAADSASYVGSPEHKDTPSFAGHPRPRADATICDRSFVTRLDEINRWLRDAIRTGKTGAWTGSFPRYAWHREDDTVFEARLVNEVKGDYKGYALKREEWPGGL
jgi:hypothetical protein